MFFFSLFWYDEEYELVRSLRRRPTDIGYIFELLLCKQDVLVSFSDFANIEIMTHRISSKPYIILFNYSPIGESYYKVKRIQMNMDTPVLEAREKKFYYILFIQIIL